MVLTPEKYAEELDNSFILFKAYMRMLTLQRAEYLALRANTVWCQELDHVAAIIYLKYINWINIKELYGI